MTRIGRWHGVLSATKDNSSSTVHGPAEAFFLGRMIICSNEHCHYDFVSPVRHNHGYANPNLLAEHRELIHVLAKSVGGGVSRAQERAFRGIRSALPVAQRHRKDDSRARANRHSERNLGYLETMLADGFDGPASYNHKRGTQANTRSVVDCPLANEREVTSICGRCRPVKCLMLSCGTRGLMMGL